MDSTLSRPDPWILDRLQQTNTYFQEQQLQPYLVGGSVRDLFLHEPCHDWDIAVSGDVPRLARQLANQLGGYYAYLHEKASRVILKLDGDVCTLDINPLQGRSIENDLRERDFTINAIALPLENALAHLRSNEPLTPIDPLHGVQDLETRTLHAVNKHVFQNDPLRMLRAVRFIMRYQLTLNHHTEQMLLHHAHLLTKVAPERIHEELYTILSAPEATARLRFLDEHKLFTTLFPEFTLARGMLQPGLHYWDVLEHSMETVHYLELLMQTLQLPASDLSSSRLEIGQEGDLLALQELLQEAERQGLLQYSTLTSPTMKLAALLHDIGKPTTYTVDEEGEIRFYGHPQIGVPIARDILNRLSVSTQNRRLIEQVVANHMRPGQLSSTVISPRAIRRYFVDMGPTGIQVALISLADHLAMRGPLPLTDAWHRHLATVRLLLTRYIRERERILPPRLLQAEELIHKLHLKPGPIIGQLLEVIAEAQAEGKVQSKDEALWLAEEHLHRQEL